MKKTQIMDILRNIRKQKVSFISVIVIAMLGVAVFLGLDYSAAGITRNGSAYFNAQDFRDIEIISTLLLTQEDLEDIRSTEGVTDVEAVLQVGAKASSGGETRDAYLTDAELLLLDQGYAIPLYEEVRFFRLRSGFAGLLSDGLGVFRFECVRKVDN